MGDNYPSGYSEPPSFEDEIRAKEDRIETLSEALEASQARVRKLEAAIKPAALWFSMFSRSDHATAKIANDLSNALKEQGGHK